MVITDKCPPGAKFVRFVTELGTDLNSDSMSVVSVQAAGLESLAGVCTAHSTAVAANLASAAPAASFQPSAAAVSAIHTEAGVAGAALSGRLASTATHLGSAAVGYTAQDADSARVLAELPVTV